MFRFDPCGGSLKRLATTLDRLDPGTHRRAGFALWASVSEARSTRFESARDLTLLCLAAGGGAVSFAILARWLGTGWAELTLVSGSFCVGYLKRFGVLGGGIGSQLFIGQLLAYGAMVMVEDLGTVALAVGLAIVASVVPRTLSGPAEQPALAAQFVENADGPTLPAQEMVAAARSMLSMQAAEARASAAVALAEWQLARTKLTSPVSGTVVNRRAI